MGLLGDLLKSKRRILVADDNPAVRDLVSDVLSAEGFSVTATKDGQEALEAFAPDKFDLLILDVHMPKLEGPELLAKIRALPGGKEQAVMMLTSEKLSGTIAKVFELNAAEYMFKPFQVTDLLLKVNASLPPPK